MAELKKQLQNTPEGRQAFWNVKERNIVQTLEDMKTQGFLAWNPETKKYKAFTGMIDLENDYLFFNLDNMHKGCLYNFDIFFSKFNIIPSYCQENCWKIVIKLENVYDMYVAFNVLEDQTDWHGKAGIDGRNYTDSYFSAFVYNLGFEEAQERWPDVVRLMQREIGGDRFHENYMEAVILKRGCTEMEAKLPSTKWQILPGQVESEIQIMEYLEPIDSSLLLQPDWLYRQKFSNWCIKANHIGDKSYKLLEEITGPIDIGVKSVTYHQEGWLNNEGSINGKTHV